LPLSHPQRLKSGLPPAVDGTLGRARPAPLRALPHNQTSA
jgi:hypothetical protein